jgi:hypothetical protein
VIFEKTQKKPGFPVPEAWPKMRGGASVAAYSDLPILNSFVPHVAHVPVVAGFPFFMVVGLGSLTSRFCLHFMQ